jgi:hypothetical protein
MTGAVSREAACLWYPSTVDVPESAGDTARDDPYRALPGTRLAET